MKGTAGSEPPTQHRRSRVRPFSLGGLREIAIPKNARAGEFATEGRFNSPPEADETATPGRRHRAVRRG